MSEEILIRHRAIWRQKPVLHALYTNWYGEMVSHLVPGMTLELGGGTGNLKEFTPDVICTDIVKAPWLDAVADGQALPFRNGSLANLVLFDVLHHIENVRLFFDEAVRVLRVGGRIVIMDPYISWCSWPVYRFLHPEPVDLSQDPMQVRPPDPDRLPFDANQAVATILFERSFETFSRQFPGLVKRVHHRLAFFAYPLSGGFDHPSLLPMFAVRPLLTLERALGFLDRVLAFRIFVVLEKRG
ncbi:MAG: methyltransferase [Nitrospirae bacterium RIFCSPLOWO2_02_FULL_62_14]|nr:MAG: methyltransferase [Nitrospirae bacterium RIFCSPLOWO2_02_FULL_62_14]